MLFRLDIVGLHTEAKPTVGVQDGTTLYWVDTRQFFIYYKGTWYEQTESQDEEPADATPADDNER